ncbi:hypothetical protein DOY81_014202 [Sarcophaga bullata]|nr:hypothetical protein DOY81_014202 [Sarcophaga bullata]
MNCIIVCSPQPEGNFIKFSKLPKMLPTTSPTADISIFAESGMELRGMRIETLALRSVLEPISKRKPLLITSVAPGCSSTKSIDSTEIGSQLIESNGFYRYGTNTFWGNNKGNGFR